VEDLLSFDKFKSSANNDDLDIITSPTNEKWHIKEVKINNE
jgi:hypothetical protein